VDTWIQPVLMVSSHSFTDETWYPLCLVLERHRKVLTRQSSPANMGKAGKEEALFDKASTPRDQCFACAELRGFQFPAEFVSNFCLAHSWTDILIFVSRM